MEDDVAGHHWDLGSIPRSPKRLFYFFIICSNAALVQNSIMQPHRSACQVSQKTDPKAKDERLWCSLVKACIANSQKSTKACNKWARIASSKPPSGPTYPPWFYYFLFFLFLLFSLITINII